MRIALAVFVLLIHATNLILLAFLSIRVIRNLRFLWWVQNLDNTQPDYPRVSILVPARNEGQNIRQCLKSLVQQDYPNYEILVLDDQSTDNTLAQIQALAAHHPVIQVLRGESAPPTGWNGKSYACHRLSEQAQGEWLLFTDADTLHTPQSIRQGMQQASQLDVDLLSVMPYQITKSWSEWLLVSFIMDFLPLLGVDLRRLWLGNGQAVANGQYVLVRRETYQALGGHAAISHALVDDFALAQHFVKAKQRIAFVSGASMLSCRMYHNAGEVWHGFTKNILLSLQSIQQWGFALIFAFAWGYSSLFVMPYVIFALYPAKWLALVGIVWLTLLRLVAGFAARRSPVEALFTPLAAVGVMLLGLNAISLKLRQQRITWKERPYHINQ
jgi:chlorobactene glucosyltransferase